MADARFFSHDRPLPGEYWEQDIVCPICEEAAISWWDFAHRGSIISCGACKSRDGHAGFVGGGPMYPDPSKQLRVRIDPPLPAREEVDLF